MMNLGMFFSGSQVITSYPCHWTRKRGPFLELFVLCIALIVKTSSSIFSFLTCFRVFLRVLTFSLLSFWNGTLGTSAFRWREQNCRPGEGILVQPMRVWTPECLCWNIAAVRAAQTFLWGFRPPSITKTERHPFTSQWWSFHFTFIKLWSSSKWFPILLSMSWGSNLSLMPYLDDRSSNE